MSMGAYIPIKYGLQTLIDTWAWIRIQILASKNSNTCVF